MTPQEAVRVRKDLRRQIKRAHLLAHHCIGQTCDADLPVVDRETSEKRARLAIRTAGELERQLERVEEALNG